MLGSAPTRPKRRPGRCRVVFLRHIRPFKTLLFTQIGRIGRDRGRVVRFGRVLVVFGRFWSYFFPFEPRFYGF